MLIEASRIKNLPVIDHDQNKLGVVESLYFDGDKGSLVGFKILKSSVLNKFYALDYLDADITSQQSATVEGKSYLKESLTDFDSLLKKFGKVIGARAVTQSGKSLGKIEDIMIEVESGLIVRFVLRNYIVERIIPRQFVVSITPKRIIFQDVVDQPIFDKVASGELSPQASKS
jgi:uncharacterized protein YrrD